MEKDSQLVAQTGLTIPAQAEHLASRLPTREGLKVTIKAAHANGSYSTTLDDGKRQKYRRYFPDERRTWPNICGKRYPRAALPGRAGGGHMTMKETWAHVTKLVSVNGGLGKVEFRTDNGEVG